MLSETNGYHGEILPALTQPMKQIRGVSTTPQELSAAAHSIAYAMSAKDAE